MISITPTADASTNLLQCFLLFKSIMNNQVIPIRNQLAHFRGNLDRVQYNALKRDREWLATRPRPEAIQAEDLSIRVEEAIKVEEAVNIRG